jgi:hypothetical protein
MRSAGVILVMVIVTTAAVGADVPQGMKLHRSDACGIEFLMPRSWTVVEDEQARSGWLEHDKRIVCSVGLKPRDWELTRKLSQFELAPYAVSITVVKGGFRSVADASGFFQVKRLRAGIGNDAFPKLDGEEWLMAIRQGETPAEWVATKCCRGIRATGFSRVRTKNGAIGSVYPRRALLNDYRGTSVLVESDSNHAVADSVVGTLAIIDRAAH